MHPEYCSPPAYDHHRRRVDAVLRNGSLVIANSDSTADELTRYASAHALPAPRICVAPLGLEPRFLERSPEPFEAPAYFVCVGTIEPRKNITFLLTLWRRLAQNMGEATPLLVLAGQRGWENESVIDQLERSPPIRRFVHEAPGLSDVELARLIGGARALLAPSFTEGFNLPVAEAMALGTPVIASDIPVHRELARGATLVDPLDGPAWLAAIDLALLRRAAPLAPSRPLGWPEHFAIVGRALGLGTD
jgi:glycosyltransferase involved in cell wall biosynthesis